MSPSLHLCSAPASLTAALAAMEAASFPADETASLEQVQWRCDVAARYCCALILRGDIAAAAGPTADEVRAAVATGVVVERVAGDAPAASQPLLAEPIDGDLPVGFVLSTRSDAYDEESLKTHSPTGPLLCIHSVCTSPSWRRLGLATAMLKAYVALLGGATAVADGESAFKLICKAHLEGFYASCGFALVGPSPVLHGQDPWLEMEIRVEA